MSDAPHELRARLEAAQADALRVYRENQAAGASRESLAFDSGRYEGLKQALEIVEQGLARM
jgi:hypothetical protein